MDQREGSAFNSRVVHIRPRYSANAPERLPSRLVLKRMERGWGDREVAFYRRVRDAALSMVVPCYLADLDEPTGSSLLLLEDVSSTHHESVSRQSLLACDGVPPSRDLDRIMTSLAQFHAYWWEHRDLGRVEPLLVRTWYRDDLQFRKLVARREREWASFSAEIPDDDRMLYEGALARLPTLWRHLGGRIGGRRNLTLSHGDCYLTHWLCPQADGGHTYLIDFDSVTANFAAFDLVFLIATFWTRDQRRTHEERCLRRYHDALLETGAAKYEWNDLMADFRLMLALIVWDPVFDQTNGSSPTYWRPKMRCLADAYRDWQCEDL